MNFKHYAMAALISGGLILTGCGSSSSESTTSTTSSVTQSTGYLVDAPVQGLDYKCIDTTGKTVSEGITGSNGDFNYSTNIFTCQFGINSSSGFLTLYQLTLTATSALNNYDAIPSNMIVFSMGANVQMILQTMDNDGNLSNGIQITPEEKTAFASNFTQTQISQLTTPDSIYSTLSSNVPDYNGKEVNLSTATANLYTTISKIIKTGTYKGTFTLTSGDPNYCLASGTVTLNVSVDPTINQVTVSGNAGNSDENYTLSGSFDGFFTGVTNDGDNTMWYGYYTTDNKIAGYYSSGTCAGKWEVTVQ